MSTETKSNLQKISTSELPIVVDLDRTLVARDIFQSLAITHFLRRPLEIVRFIQIFFTLGKAASKKFLSERTQFYLDQHPLNEALIEYLKNEKSKGKTLVLCSGADMSHVEIVANHVGLFDEHIGSQDTTNLVGKAKKDFLISRFGEGQFNYIGDSKIDLVVGEAAKHTAIIFAYAGTSEKKRSTRQSLKIILKQLRIKHWLKNLLIFVPVLTAHQSISVQDAMRAVGFFLAFSLLASGTYILNDLHDMAADASHPDKKKRPIVSGAIKITTALSLAALLIVAGVLLATATGPFSLMILAAYFLLTTLYSVKIKRVLILDVVCLSGLYTLRIVAGTILLNLKPTFWLLAFSLFIFFSLAAVKRFTELLKSKRENIPGRGYVKADAEIVGQLGLASGFSGIIVFALYINSAEITPFYKHPQLLWFGLIILLYWVSYLWLKTRRGEINSDPIDWAVTDVRSAASFLSLVIVALLATYV